MKKKKDEVTIRSSAAEYLTYVASVGDQQDSIEMRYEDENIWLTQKMMATLYDVGLPTINEHIKKIYADVYPWSGILWRGWNRDKRCRGDIEKCRTSRKRRYA